MAVYDCFIFNDELNLLDIRLHELAPVVDKFILVESAFTFSGKSKPIVFQENKERYKDYPIQAYYTSMFVVGDPTPQQIWNNEILQRNALLVPGIQDDDIMMISDVDEIPSREVVSQLKGEPTKLEQRFSYYYLNMVQQDPRTVWYGTTVATAKEIRRVTPQSMRLCVWSKDPEMPIIKSG